MKSYTDLEQSKKLAEILPLESADMRFCFSHTLEGEIIGHYPMIGREPSLGTIPCWSLSALLKQLPYEVCDDYGDSLFLKMDKDSDVYQLTYIDTYGIANKIYTDRYEHFVDACVAMIEKLHELNLL